MTTSSPSAASTSARRVKVRRLSRPSSQRGFVRATAGRLRWAQQAQTQAAIRPRGRATRPTRRSAFVCGGGLTSECRPALKWELLGDRTESPCRSSYFVTAAIAPRKKTTKSGRPLARCVPVARLFSLLQPIRQSRKSVTVGAVTVTARGRAFLARIRGVGGVQRIAREIRRRVRRTAGHPRLSVALHPSRRHLEFTSHCARRPRRHLPLEDPMGRWIAADALAE